MPKDTMLNGKMVASTSSVESVPAISSVPLVKEGLRIPPEDEWEAFSQSPDPKVLDSYNPLFISPYAYSLVAGEERDG